MLSEQTAQRKHEPRAESRAAQTLYWFSVLGSWFWSAGAPIVLVLAALLCCLLAYQPRFALSDRLTRTPSNIRLKGVYAVEGAGPQAQRWTSPHATLRFTGVGVGSYALWLRFHGGADAGAGRALMVSAGSAQSGTAVPVRADWQELELAIPAAAVDQASGDLVIALDIAPMADTAGDPRKLGVALQDVALRPLDSSVGWLARLPMGRAAQLALTLLLAFWSLRIVGARTRIALSVGLALTLIVAAGLATTRMDAAQLLDLALRMLPWTFLLALVLRAIPHIPHISRSSPITHHPSPGYILTCCAVLLIFTLRLGGLLHSQYINIDQRLRANQLLNIAAGRVDVVRPQLEQQYEWGTREPVPYSLLTYYLLVPLTWFWHDDALITAMETTSVLLDATVPLLLWALLARDGRRVTGALAAGFAGVCYAALPVGYLFFHDGSFPTTIGVWFALVALVSVRLLVAHAQPPNGDWRLPAAYCLLATVALALALVAYVTQIAFVGFLVTMIIASVWLLTRQRRAAALLACTLAGALLIDWLLYYREYTATLLQRTIPAFMGQIVEHGSVGHDTGLLYNTAVNSFGQHLQAHFRVWPVLLGAAALIGLLLHRRNHFVAHVGLAYALFFAATALAERWFGLWNKHMYFAAPGVALLAGVGLAWLWRHGRVGQVLCVTLLAFLFWESTLAWGNRALWYVLPASAL